MAKTLVIVESPTKAKAIGKFLGSRYVVKSSMGHVRDLPKSQIGIDVENNFEPKYINIRGRADLLKSLKSAAKDADKILLASDPDREGEVIAWHLKELLGCTDPNCRVEFNEITKDAVKAAIAHPHQIDMNRVNAQQARRVLDRLVGYKLSPLLWKKVKKGLSAGRVQSVAVRLICDRENEIQNFVPQEYWTLDAMLDSGHGVLKTKLQKINNAKAEIADKASMDSVLNGLTGAEYMVDSVTKKERLRKPAPPFTTSSLQQEAVRKLNFPAKKTMQLAQQLYEGIDLPGEGVVGLITYMRTDSVRIAEQAQSAAREYIIEKYGKEYVPGEPPVYVSKGKIQNAHEAIRPTGILRTPALVKPHLTPQQFKLYKLIWERFVASQMGNAVLDVTTVDVAAGSCVFRSSGSVIKFAGFMQVYIEGKDDAADDDNMQLLPALSEGQKLNLVELLPKQCFTQPPARFTEATLVKTLEEQGIGRPSTYAPIIDTILARGYVVKEEKAFYPTELGTIVVNLLKENFTDIMNINFTADMEVKLDEIEEGELEWRKVVGDFYYPFADVLKLAEENMGKVEIKPEESGEFCEKCGKPMLIRIGRYGKFLACAGFPECHNTKPIVHQIGVKCLACGGNIIERKSRGGRLFYGCDNYPKCNYISWNRPIEEKCQSCGTQLTQKTSVKGDSEVLCPNKDCPTNANRAGSGRRGKGKTETAAGGAEVPKKTAAKSAAKTTVKKKTAKSSAAKTKNSRAKK